MAVSTIEHFSSLVPTITNSFDPDSGGRSITGLAYDDFSDNGAYTNSEGISGFKFSFDGLSGVTQSDGIYGVERGQAGIQSVLVNGDDVMLIGGIGTDIIVGGFGSDESVLDVLFSVAQLVKTYTGIQTTSAEGTDVYFGVGSFQFSDQTISYDDLGARVCPIGFDPKKPATPTLGIINTGTNQNDLILGGTGPDALFGQAGFDHLNGGEGNDLLEGGHQADNLFGGTGDDTLRGGQGFDRLFGGDGNDTLFGGAGFDTLIGGTGNDLLLGNFNADRFVFADGHGNDTIGDFATDNGFEKIDLSNVSAIVNLFDLLNNHATQAGANVLIDTGGGDSITLTGVNLADLDSSDFVF